MTRTRTYFASDTHLGLDVKDPAAREKRFVDFLKSIPAEQTEAVYLLGDIWDFWYEWRDVVPKGYTRVFAAIQDLIDAGVKVCFFEGNHDIWSYSYFESLGMIRMTQPAVIEIGGKKFCIGHGDGLGEGDRGYKMLKGFFHCRTAQVLFSMLHPWFAFRLGNNWSKHSRLAKSQEYTFRGKDERLYKFCETFPEPVDYFIFGHYHCKVDMPVGSARLLILKDWMDGSDWICYTPEEGITRA